jgi:radical SAM superfamily enzyme
MVNNKGNKMSQMSRYIVYQLPEDNAKIRDLSFMNPLEVEAISDEFKVVAIVDARSLDEVFRIGNFIVEEDSTLIDLVCDDMHSISVGDIIHNITTDETHVVDRFGFVKINMKEVV